MCTLLTAQIPSLRNSNSNDDSVHGSRRHPHVRYWQLRARRSWLEKGIKFLFYPVNRGKVDNFSLFDCSNPFCFLLIEFHCTFSISYKRLTNYCYYYCILMMIDEAFGTSFFFRNGFASFHTHNFLLISFFVCFFYYFILTVPIRECLEKYSWTSSSCPIVILIGPCFFLTAQLQVHIVYS